MNTGYLKYFGVLLCLFAVAALLPPASAATWESINMGVDVNGVNWTGNTTAPYDSFYNAGDGRLDTWWYHYNQPVATITWLNPLGIYYSKIRIFQPAGTVTWWNCNGVYGYSRDGWGDNFSISGNGPITCYNTTLTYARIAEIQYENGTPPAPIANFTGTPTSGSSPLTVSFTDTSTNLSGGESYNWSVSPAPGVAIDTPAAANTLMHFPAVGNYTIGHGVSNAAGSNILTKIDYIRAYNSTSDYTTTGFAVMDEPRWIQLAGATINLHDIENNTWKNTTASTLGYAEITTLSNHTISAYASMTGYADADLLNKPAWSNGVYPILMFPTGYGNVSKGNITLYVNVWANSARLPGATVNMAYNDGVTQFNDYRVTGLSGTATFVVPNKTTIYLYGEKAGYSRSGTTINSGTGDGGSASVTADITLTQGTITPTATITTLPGGGTPTPIQTEDPYPCDADHPENCQRKETEMGNSLVAWGPMLINFFIVLTIVGGLKLMGK